MSELTKRQQHVLVAMLNQEEAGQRPGFAGAIAWRLGYRRGPRQSGNGAKDNRSFSGYGSPGKWTAGSLMSLAKRGLVRRYYADVTRMFGGLPDRVYTNELTAAGREKARELKAAGVKEQEVREVKRPGGYDYEPV